MRVVVAQVVQHARADPAQRRDDHERHRVLAVAAQRQCVVAQEIQAVARFDDHRNHLGQRLILQLILIREKKFGLLLIAIIIINQLIVPFMVDYTTGML